MLLSPFELSSIQHSQSLQKRLWALLSTLSANLQPQACDLPPPITFQSDWKYQHIIDVTFAVEDNYAKIVGFYH